MKNELPTITITADELSNTGDWTGFYTENQLESFQSGEKQIREILKNCK